jgi:hypothetical protein
VTRSAAVSVVLSAVLGAVIIAQGWPQGHVRALRTAAISVGFIFWIVMVFAYLIVKEFERLAILDRD